MIDYATNDNVCRSRQLLRYFGETESYDCQQCDVCLDHSRHHAEEARRTPAAEKILRLFDDGKEHLITELRDLQLPTDELDAALEYLLKEEYLAINDSLLSKL